ncbi:hypothetical protein H0H92_006260, partial [Tricholoma furcatifolium]
SDAIPAWTKWKPQANIKPQSNQFTDLRTQTKSNQRLRLLSLALRDIETIKIKLEEVARDWSKLPHNPITLCIPIEYASIQAALTGEESYQLAITGVHSIRVEIIYVEDMAMNVDNTVLPESLPLILTLAFGDKEIIKKELEEVASDHSKLPRNFLSIRVPVEYAAIQAALADEESYKLVITGLRNISIEIVLHANAVKMLQQEEIEAMTVDNILSPESSDLPSQPSSSNILDNRRLLDVMVNQSTSIHRNLLAATQRLAGASGLYPTCYELDGVSDTGIYQCSGGFADVYKAYFRGQVVLSKEAILWGQLRHPNVLPFYGIYRIKDRISFVAPWMENGDVSKFLNNNQNSNRVLLSIDVAQGLEFLHKNDIVHGDLKGGNILVNESGRACVADFGLSSVSDREILAWTSYSSVASKGGTVRWQAPELFNLEGEEEVHNTKASDIYAWAFVAYEIFTGEVPFAHLFRDTTIVNKVLGGERPGRPVNSSLSWSAWGLTEDIWKLMETCWNSDPDQRPNVTAVIERLERALPSKIQKDAEVQTNGDSLSPGQFRKMARGEVDENELSVETLDNLLAH